MRPFPWLPWVFNPRQPGAATLIQRDTWADGPAGKLRLRWTLPEGDGPFPWVMYLQGYAPGTVAFLPDGEVDPLRCLLRELNDIGYATVRAEKRGKGGSGGPKAEDAGFEEEHEDFRAALAALAATEWVRGERGVLFGHSLGGLHAPRLAAGVAAVRGVALYGVGWLTWAEYTVASRRRMLAMAGVGAAQAEAALRVQQRFDARVLQEGVEVEAALAGMEAHRDVLGVDAAGRLYGRTGRYWREVQACPVAGPLLAMEVPALVMWGSSDWLSQREEHVAMAEAINAARPGSARYVEVAGADHEWRSHATAEASRAANWTGGYAPGVAAALVGWLRG